MPAGAILCGGASTRMGRDKAFIEVDGVPMVLRVATALREAGCHPVFAVGGNQAALIELGIEFVADLHPGEGPVGGVLTALTACATPGVVVVACDLPRLSADTIRSLVAASGAAPAIVATTDRLQPLCVLWSLTLLDFVAACYGAGERRLHAVLEQIEIQRIVVDPQDLDNVNAPGDLSK